MYITKDYTSLYSLYKKFLYDVYFSDQVSTIRDDYKEGYIYVLRKHKNEK